MNNAYLKTEDEKEPQKEVFLRERLTQLTDLIEALTAIAGSSHWLVLKQNVFDVDLDKAKRSLAKEKDTTEIFRLQGEIRWGEKFNLEKLLQKHRDELTAIRKEINE